MELKNSLLHIGVITQARMTSSRLPGKILKKIKQKSLLQYHTERLQKTGFHVVVATTTNVEDDIVCDFSTENNLDFYRGCESNVLSRFYGAAEKYKLDIIIRVTSDCPLIDPHLIRNAVEKYLRLNNDNLYISNVIVRTFARGFDFEVFSFKMLHDAYRNAIEEAELEHVTPYIWKNKSGRVEIIDVKQETNNSDLRITVDTSEDFELIRQLIETYNAEELPYNAIEALLRNQPELIAINAHIEQKKE